MSVNGDASTGPMRLGTAIVDMGTGLYSTIGILMALHERERLDQDRARRPRDELYYLIQYPRVPDSPYPLREQRERYERWFAASPHPELIKTIYKVDTLENGVLELQHFQRATPRLEPLPRLFFSTWTTRITRRHACGVAQAYACVS